MLININQNLNTLSESSSFSVLYFSAPWCGPCKSYGPIIEAISNKYNDIPFGKINCDENNELTSKYEVRSIPTTIFMKGDSILERKTGSLTNQQLEQIIEKYK